MKNKFIWLVICVLASISPVYLYAQSARSLYFIDNAPARLNLNPALQPMHGYFNIPVIGAFSASAVSDPLSINDFIDILDQKNGFLDNDELFNKLKTNNKANLDLNFDILSFGFYAGKGFWTVNLGTKVMFSTSIPKTLFEFARNSDGITELFEQSDLSSLPPHLEELVKGYQVKDLKINADAFIELGVGYSRPVNKNLTLGGRVKLLVGAANLEAQVNEMSITPDISNQRWNVTTQGAMEVSMKGLSLGTDETEGYIDDLDFDSPGIGGYGAGIDLGATYTFLNRLTLSAAVIDLGFINWSESSTTKASVNESHYYMVDDEEGTQVLDYDLIQFKEDETSKGRTTSLRPTLNLGAEYTFFNKKLGIGLLSTTRFQKPKKFSELTISANYHPRNWFAATLSYSFLHSDFKTFGLGLKLGPVFVASDYMITENLKSISRANAYLGISIPLGKRKIIE